MGFRLRKPTGSVPDSPEALFRDLRNRSVEGLLSQQADMLRAYISHVDTPDVALQMPTGSGKTLVGLLIAEWRRRRFRQRVVYLCPTRQLVNQVVEQAVRKYGIHAIPFIGSKWDYASSDKSAYTNAEVLAVTTYSGLFNTSPFFDNANAIVLDDIHAAENYVADFWSLRIDRRIPEQRTLFAAVLSVLKDDIPSADYARLMNTDPSPFDASWVNKIPTPVLYRLHDELIAVLDANITDGTDLSFRWQVLRDHLLACHMYVNSEGFLIRPLLPPTGTHAPFSNADQRIYMSATLGEGGELERLVGKRNLARIPAPEGWEKQGVGRRLFVFPMRSLEEGVCMQLIISLIPRAGRALILTPSEREAERFRKVIQEKLPEYTLFSASEIEASKTPFVSRERAIAVVANRYDGIDLVGDECRLLIVSGLPDATNLQERFLISRMGASILYNDRIITRITQATGRCTRSATDYATVIILGEQLNKFLLQPEKRAFFHPELQAEMEFGIEESRDRGPGEFSENFRIFLSHGKEWQPADEAIVELRDKTERRPLPCLDAFINAAPHEVDYQYAMWDGDYATAVACCRGVLAHLGGEELRGYRAFWCYLAGSAAWLASQRGAAPMDAVARDYFDRAAQAASGIPWLSELGRIGLSQGVAADDENGDLDLAIERLEERIESLGTVHDGKFERYVQQIMAGLRQKKASEFERAQVQLGDLLGYEAGNSDEQSAPDPWWILGETFGLVFEDYTDCNEDATISTTKVRQAASHPKWFAGKAEYSGTNFTPVLVTTSKQLDVNAIPFARGVSYWDVEDFVQWADEAITTVRLLRRSFSGPGDLAWRAEAKRVYKEKGLTPKGILEHATANKLADLGHSSSKPVAGDSGERKGTSQ